MSGTARIAPVEVGGNAAILAGESALVLLLLSRLTASPHDWDEAVLAECEDLFAAAILSVDEPALCAAMAQLRAGFRPTDAAWQAQLAREYSALFEVGTAGPPLPIREELTASAAGGAKEEVVRFYELFGYAVQPRYEWAPDHLSLLLEFAAWVAGLESGATSVEDAHSLRCAQRDFLERHLAHWVPALAIAVQSFAPGSFHATVLRTLDLFLGQQRTRLAAPAGA